ncbi:MAG: hypothetical protein JO033_02995 [Acidobacteriaceae bacterium]|nr:hypothetical protein [Acidobacteriaceae bacterium]MBV9500431.1 hypothetical protein [Acidobacteriaceae bacterium]
MAKLGRLLSAILISSTLLTVWAMAQTQLTEILDTVANSNGTLFNGTVVITWIGGAGPNGSTVSPLTTTTRIENGALTVLLVPSTTGTNAYYQAVYSSADGTATWTETWNVPPSSVPLTLAQVRASTTQGTGSGNTSSSGNSSGGGTISISDVTNLSADLNAINSSLTSLTVEVNNLSSVMNSGVSLTGVQNQINVLNTAVTNLTSTVAVLNSTVSGLQTTVSGLSSSTSINATFVDAETPQGSVNGTNSTFTLSQAPSPTASLMLYRNGLVQASGIDFTLSGQSITFLSASIPKSGDTLLAFYRAAGTTTSVNFSDSETPSGTINGVNLTFTLAAAPNPTGSLKLFKNGVLLQQGGDYTLSGSTITFKSTAVTPQTGDVLIADYRH